MQFLSHVGLFVLVQITLGGEPPFTYLTQVRFFPGVSPHVAFQLAQGRKRFIAYITSQSTFPCVNPQVALQLPLIAESVTTLFAFVFLLAKMGEQMPFQVPVTFETLS